MRKAVFFDIDGTLWDHHMKIPSSTVEAVRKLRENGNYAFICSGRSRAAIQAKELLEGVGFDGILGACGTYIEYEGEDIFNRELSKEELLELFSCFQTYQTPIVLEGKQYLYADMNDFGSNVYIQNLKKSLGEGFQPMDVHAGRYHANKMTAYFTKGDIQNVKDALKDHFDLIFHTAQVFEIVPKGYSKAKGIRWICDYLHIPPEDTYAFGDSVNDLEMLSYVEHGIAMGNGTDAAKEAADYITSDIWEDGIMRGLKHFSLI